MNAENVTKLLTMLGCSRIKVRHKWVDAPCPFAPWLHQRGSDSTPSFSIAISVDGTSNYKCLSCQSKGDLKSLVYKLERKSGRNMAKVMDFVQLHDQPSLDTMKKKLETSTYWGSTATEIGGVKVSKPPFFLTHPEDGKPLEEPLEEAELAKLTTDFPEDVWAYLTGPKNPGDPGSARGLTPETVKTWELRWHPQAKRVGVPVRDVKGRLVSISGRAFYKWQKPKFLHTTGFKRDLYLYGEHRVQKGGIGILVEGFFDVQRIAQVGFPLAVAVMGSHLSAMQVEKLSQFFKFVLIIPDGDKAGYDAAAAWTKALKGRVPTAVMAVKDGSDPDELEHDQIQTEIAKYAPVA